jgi:hypothetical protein
MAAVLVLALRGALANVLEDRIVGFYAWIVIGLAIRGQRPLEPADGEAAASRS